MEIKDLRIFGIFAKFLQGFSNFLYFFLQPYAFAWMNGFTTGPQYQ